MTNEEPATTNDNVNPSGDSYDDYVLPNDTEWTEPPCAGSVGSSPNLDNIQAQITENQSAAAEHRQARPLAIKCGFCQGYHKEMQPSIASLIGGEVIGDYTSDNPPASDTPVELPPEEPPVNPDTSFSDIFPTETNNEGTTSDDSSSTAG